MRLRCTTVCLSFQRWESRSQAISGYFLPQTRVGRGRGSCLNIPFPLLLIQGHTTESAGLWEAQTGVHMHCTGPGDMEEAGATSGRTLYLALRNVASIPEMTMGRKVLLKRFCCENGLHPFLSHAEMNWRGGEESLLAVGMGRGQIQEVYRGRLCKELISPEFLVL